MRLIVLVVLVNLSGCSWLFHEHLKGTPDGRSEPRCSVSNGLPVLDAAIAALGAIAIAIYATSKEDPAAERAKVIGGGAADLLIFGASAATGFHWTSECRRAHRATRR